jgi:hypothetical protein
MVNSVYKTGSKELKLQQSTVPIVNDPKLIESESMVHSVFRYNQKTQLEKKVDYEKAKCRIQSKSHLLNCVTFFSPHNHF